MAAKDRATACIGIQTHNFDRDTCMVFTIYHLNQSNHPKVKKVLSYISKVLKHRQSDDLTVNRDSILQVDKCHANSLGLSGPAYI